MGWGGQAIVNAGIEISAGAVNCAIAGGLENMGLVPYFYSEAMGRANRGQPCMTACSMTGRMTHFLAVIRGGIPKSYLRRD